MVNIFKSKKFLNMPREQRAHTTKRFNELVGNVSEYNSHMIAAQSRVDHWKFQLEKTEKELQKMTESLKDT